MTRAKDSETTQVTHAGSRADDDDDDRCPCAECGLVGSATLARDLEREEVDKSVLLEKALVAGQTTFETLVVGSAVGNDAMGAPENTRLRVRPCPNPWSTTEREWHLAGLPRDGVIEHRAIIAPQTPPREPRQERRRRQRRRGRSGRRFLEARRPPKRRPRSALLSQRRSSAPTRRYPPRHRRCCLSEVKRTYWGAFLSLRRMGLGLRAGNRRGKGWRTFRRT